MTAVETIAAWIAERDAVLEAEAKGFERPPALSVAVGSWNGSVTTLADLRREASVLRFLQLVIAEGAEVEEARATAGPPPLSREDARAAVAGALSLVLQRALWQGLPDAILDALGWPS